MLFRKGLVFVLSLSLFGACSSTQSSPDSDNAPLNSEAADEKSGLSRTEAQKKWTTQVGKLRANMDSQIGKEKENSYWLTPELFSLTLSNNRYYSKVLNRGFMPYSRNFCGSSSYDELILEQIGSRNGRPRARNYEMTTDVGWGQSGELGSDAILVSISMTVFELGENVIWDAVGKELFQEMQDAVASQSSGRCQFTMRKFFRQDVKFSDKRLIDGWWTEPDLLCAKKPCIGEENDRFESLLSDFEYAIDDKPSFFFLIQKNLSGRPMMRTVFFQPRPADGSLMLLEVVSMRKRYVDREMSTELAEQHAKTARDLFSAWETRSAQYSNLEGLELLYQNSKPLTEDAIQQIENAKLLCGGCLWLGEW